MKKRLLSLMLSFSIVISFCASPIKVSAAVSFSGGKGTNDNPYLISDYADLKELAEYVNSGNSTSGKYFMLTNSISVNNTSDYKSWSNTYRPANEWTPIGTYDNPFNGFFDGNGYYIKGIYINTTESYQGIFGRIKDGSVTELSISKSYIKGGDYTGGIAGHLYDYTDDEVIIIANCHNFATISGGDYTGGIFGCLEALDGEIEVKKCTNKGSVNGNSYVGGIAGQSETRRQGCYIYIENSSNSATIKGNMHVGGIVGRHYQHKIGTKTAVVKNCYNTGNITGTTYIGGIAGYSDHSKIENCYNTGTVTGNSSVGGISGYENNLSWANTPGELNNCYNIGYVFGNNSKGGITSGQSGGRISNCYFLDTCITNATTSIGKALTLEEMKKQSSYSGFNFSSYWEIGKTEDYDFPTLKSNPHDTSLWVEGNAMDMYIIEQVTKYTSDDMMHVMDKVLSGNYPDDTKFQLLNEIFQNYGLTDANEGIQFLSDASSHRMNYRYLTTNDIYCAYNFGNWLVNNPKGRLARGFLYSSGLIFNFEAKDYLDIFTSLETPGSKKYKKMLMDFMSASESTVDVLETAKKTADFFEDIVFLNNLETDHQIQQIMDQIMDTTDKNKLKNLQLEFSELLLDRAGIGEKITFRSEKFADALDTSTEILSFVTDTTNDIIDIINMEEQIAIYEKHSKFLETIYENPDVAAEMRIAAKHLHSDIELGYFKKIQNILKNCIDLSENLEKTASIDIDTMNASISEAMLIIDFSAFLINTFFIDVGDFVKQASYTQGYAELSALYCLKLKEDAERFKKANTARNAWQFFEDYNILWRLRYKGEEQFLEMSSIKSIMGEIKAFNYSSKEKIVTETLKRLNNCKFEFNEYEIPTSEQYHSKTIVNCPGNVYVYTQSGELVAELVDGIESDITTKYGRFAVVYRSYSDEYAKIICQKTEERLIIRTEAMYDGLVTLESSSINNTNNYTANNIEIKKGNIIETTDNSKYTLYNNKNDNIGTDYTLNEITPDVKVGIESININNKSGVALNIGGKYVLTTTVTPSNATDKSISWCSEDNTIATVRNGIITALGIGTTKIYAYATNNDEIFDSVEVTVYPIDFTFLQSPYLKDDILTAKCKITAGKNFSGKSYFAVYSADGTLLSVKSKEIALKMDDTFSTTETFDTSTFKKAPSYINLFLWDGTKPLAVSKHSKINYMKPATITDIRVDGIPIDSVEEATIGTITFSSDGDVAVKSIFYEAVPGTGSTIPVTDYNYTNNTISFPNGLVTNSRYTIALDLGYDEEKVISFCSKWIDPENIYTTFTVTDAYADTFHFELTMNQEITGSQIRSTDKIHLKKSDGTVVSINPSDVSISGKTFRFNVPLDVDVPYNLVVGEGFGTDKISLESEYETTFMVKTLWDQKFEDSSVQLIGNLIRAYRTEDSASNNYLKIENGRLWSYDGTIAPIVNELATEKDVTFSYDFYPYSNAANNYYIGFNSQQLTYSATDMRFNQQAKEMRTFGWKLYMPNGQDKTDGTYQRFFNSGVFTIVENPGEGYKVGDKYFWQNTLAGYKNVWVDSDGNRYYNVDGVGKLDAIAYRGQASMNINGYGEASFESSTKTYTAAKEPDVTKVRVEKHDSVGTLVSNGIVADTYDTLVSGTPGYFSLYNIGGIAAYDNMLITAYVDNISMPDQNPNRIYWQETARTNDSVTLKLIMETDKTLSAVSGSFDLTEAVSKGLTSATGTAIESTVWNVRMDETNNVIAFSLSDVNGISGKVELGEVTFDLTTVTEDFSLPQKRAFTAQDENKNMVINDFTNHAVGYLVRAFPEAV